MNFYIQQSIQINFIKISSITNSSVLQIGSAGIIKPASYMYNTGGFTVQLQRQVVLKQQTDSLILQYLCLVLGEKTLHSEVMVCIRIIHNFFSGSKWLYKHRKIELPF